MNSVADLEKADADILRLDLTTDRDGGPCVKHAVRQPAPAREMLKVGRLPERG